MARRRGKARLDLLAGLFAFALLFAVMMPAVQRAREAAWRKESGWLLKHWGLAMHNYADTYGRLPPGGWILDDGTERHGWVTSLLPYLDSSPIYIHLDLNRSWHHPRNQPLSRESIPYALGPGVTPTNTDEGYGLVHFAVNSSLMHRNSSLKLDDITSGIATTLMLGEVVGEFRPWACPWTWRTIDSPLNVSPASYGRAGRHQTDFVLADGRLKTINNNIDPDTLRQLTSGGIVVSAEDIARPPIPAAYPSTKIKRRFHPPREKGDPWSPPLEWEQPESD